MANDVTACVVCDDPSPMFAWTDLNGEGVCLQCGTPYQLMNGELEEGQTYPRCNIVPSKIDLLRRYWQETKAKNGLGRYFLPESSHPSREEKRAFYEWVEKQTVQAANQG